VTRADENQLNVIVIISGLIRKQLLLMLVDIDREFLGRGNARLARLKISWLMAWHRPERKRFDSAPNILWASIGPQALV
jgi:hypothetical protein